MYEKQKKCRPISPKYEEEPLRLTIPKKLNIKTFIKVYEEKILRMR